MVRDQLVADFRVWGYRLREGKYTRRVFPRFDGGEYPRFILRQFDDGHYRAYLDIWTLQLSPRIHAPTAARAYEIGLDWFYEQIAKLQQASEDPDADPITARQLKNFLINRGWQTRVLVPGVVDGLADVSKRQSRLVKLDVDVNTRRRSQDDNHRAPHEILEDAKDGEGEWAVILRGTK